MSSLLKLLDFAKAYIEADEASRKPPEPVAVPEPDPSVIGDLKIPVMVKGAAGERSIQRKSREDISNRWKEPTTAVAPPDGEPVPPPIVPPADRLAGLLLQVQQAVDDVVAENKALVDKVDERERLSAEIKIYIAQCDELRRENATLRESIGRHPDGYRRNSR